MVNIKYSSDIVDFYVREMILFEKLFWIIVFSLNYCFMYVRQSPPPFPSIILTRSHVQVSDKIKQIYCLYIMCPLHHKIIQLDNKLHIITVMYDF